MSFQVKYTYNLVDQLTPKLAKMRSSFRRFEDQAKKSTHTWDRAFQKMGNNLNKMSNRVISPLRNQVVGLATAFGGVFATRGALDAIAGFGQAMSKVEAVTGATNDQMEGLRKLARKLGEETQFTAGQAAEGMAFLGMAGFDATKILKSMPDVLNLAAAGNLDLATTADIASNIMTGFRIEAEQMGRVSDTLSIAAAKSNTNIFQMGDAMKFVAPVAASANISLGQTAAAIGVLSDAGMQATLAGTGLRRVISELAKPAKPAIEVLSAAGLTMKDLDIKTRGLVPVLESLRPIAEDNTKAFTVFGDRGAPAIINITKAIPKLKELTKTMEGGSGAALNMSKIMLDNLAGDTKAMVSAMESMVLSTGERGLTGTLRGLTKQMTLFFRALAGNEEAFNNLNATVQLLIKLASLIGKLAKFSFKNVIEPVSKSFLGFTDQISKGFVKLGKVTGFTDLADFSKEINQAKQARQDRFDARLDVNVKAPPGTSTNLQVPTNTIKMNTGVNSVYAGAR
jgi:TP901 family phage tail tape measure protein